MKQFFLFFLSLQLSFLFPASCLRAQVENEKPFSILDAGVQFQAYPNGLLPGVWFETNLGMHDGLGLRVAGRFINNFHSGPHDYEAGEGWGAGLSYRHYFGEKLNHRWFLGFHGDVWFDHIRWRQFRGAVKKNNGSSDVIAVQPSVELGYLFLVGKSKRWWITPAIGLGFMYNLQTIGQPVNQTVVFNAGIAFGYRFRLKPSRDFPAPDL